MNQSQLYSEALGIGTAVNCIPPTKLQVLVLIQTRLLKDMHVLYRSVAIIKLTVPFVQEKMFAN